MSLGPSTSAYYPLFSCHLFPFSFSSFVLNCTGKIYIQPLGEKKNVQSLKLLKLLFDFFSSSYSINKIYEYIIYSFPNSYLFLVPCQKANMQSVVLKAFIYFYHHAGERNCYIQASTALSVFWSVLENRWTVYSPQGSLFVFTSVQKSRYGIHKLGFEANLYTHLLCLQL